MLSNEYDNFTGSYSNRPDNSANYTTTTEEYEEQEEVTPYTVATYDEYGNELTAEVPAVEATYQTVTKTRDIVYTGPTLDKRLQNLIVITNQMKSQMMQPVRFYSQLLMTSTHK